MIKLNVESLKKLNANGFIKEIHVKWKDVVLNLLKKEKLLEMYVNNSIWKKDVEHLPEQNVLKLRREMDVIIWDVAKQKQKIIKLFQEDVKIEKVHAQSELNQNVVQLKKQIVI